MANLDGWCVYVRREKTGLVFLLFKFEFNFDGFVNYHLPDTCIVVWEFFASQNTVNTSISFEFGQIHLKNFVRWQITCDGVKIRSLVVLRERERERESEKQSYHSCNLDEIWHCSPISNRQLWFDHRRFYPFYQRPY